jgi:hypothetical protein
MFIPASVRHVFTEGFLSSLSTCYGFTEGFSEYLLCFYWGLFSVLWVPTMFLLRAFLSSLSTCYVFTEGFSQFSWVPAMFLLRGFLSSLSTCYVFTEGFSQFSEYLPCFCWEVFSVLWVSAMLLLRGFLSSVCTTVSVFILVMHCLTCNKKYSCFTTATLINIYFIYSCCLELTISIWMKRNILFLIYLYQTCADRLPFKRTDVEHHMAIC